MAVVDEGVSELLGIEVIESSETPGLGAKINEDSFKGQFRGLGILAPIQYTKGDVVAKNQIKAITGATISSKAVVNIINKRIDELRKVIAEK